MRQYIVNMFVTSQHCSFKPLSLITRNEAETKSTESAVLSEGVSAFLNKALFLEENSSMRPSRNKRTDFFIVSNHLMDERNVGNDNEKNTVMLRVSVAMIVYV